MKIAIYGQYFHHNIDPIIQEIFAYFTLNKVQLVIESGFAIQLAQRNIIKNTYTTFTAYEDLDSSYDLMLCVGGDGTILRAATIVQDTNIPILGINTGRLGFLAVIQKENIAEFMQAVIDKQYTTSKRSLLSVNCHTKHDNFGGFNFALNEISVSRKDTASMITIDTSLDGEFLTSYWADGLIIATPTGSTGYSLSCGGPVLTPDVESFVITPISPHNLNARPLVVPDKTVITLDVGGRTDHFLVSLDSRIVTLNQETVLTIQKAPFHINMVDIEGVTFIKTLRSKLLWGEDKRN